MKAIILAAGQGKRLMPLTGAKPKALVRVAGRPILQRQIEAYLRAGVAERDIFIVAGYHIEKMRPFLSAHYPAAHIIENTDYTVTNNMFSLWLALCHARETKSESACISNGDCVYDAEMVGRFAADPRKRPCAPIQ